ncbi:uncharacterized protein JN550_000651 [Neoarthrinium moseri]|uniref:uncharacterized protein n=1 Tax=Neoarthrinium moseri TaxID=1658444 RepID=UPI001FDD899B|nr:uncharacterized protein JN550_000651 [Neoarthrinium moseri]KAI1878469.1 hypothetical protein JN550_000651 [Neoarthrinium moseri]
MTPEAVAEGAVSLPPVHDAIRDQPDIFIPPMHWDSRILNLLDISWQPQETAAVMDLNEPGQGVDLPGISTLAPTVTPGHTSYLVRAFADAHYLSHSRHHSMRTLLHFPDGDDRPASKLQPPQQQPHFFLKCVDDAKFLRFPYGHWAATVPIDHGRKTKNRQNSAKGAQPEHYNTFKPSPRCLPFPVLFIRKCFLPPTWPPITTLVPTHLHLAYLDVGDIEAYASAFPVRNRRWKGKRGSTNSSPAGDSSGDGYDYDETDKLVDRASIAALMITLANFTRRHADRTLQYPVKAGQPPSTTAQLLFTYTHDTKYVYLYSGRITDLLLDRLFQPNQGFSRPQGSSSATIRLLRIPFDPQPSFAQRLVTHVDLEAARCQELLRDTVPSSVSKRSLAGEYEDEVEKPNLSGHQETDGSGQESAQDTKRRRLNKEKVAVSPSRPLASHDLNADTATTSFETLPISDKI